MELVKKYKIVILILVPVILLVILRLLGTNHFKPDAKRWAEPTFSGANIITSEKVETLAGKFLIVNLDSDKKSFPAAYEILTSTPDAILNKDILERMHDFEGSILIYSSDISISSGVWMILSQMGMTNILVLTDDKNNESQKYEFRSDTMARPEL